MIKKLLTASTLTLITGSLLVGFLVGVVFTVYKAPSVTSKLTDSRQQNTNQPDWARHIKHLEKGVKEDPNNSEFWLQLANAYYEVQNYSKSIATYLKLIPIVENKSEAYQDLGVVYRRDGQFAKSIEVFEKAIALNPDNIDALFNIGVVQYHDLKDEYGAKKAWEKVAAVNPDFQLSTGQTIQQLLEKLK